MYMPDERWYRQQLAAFGVPVHMHDGYIRYLLAGIEPGGFLVAVLANDLRAAVQRADPINQHALAAHIDFLCTAAPAAAWGSYAHVQGWVAVMTAAPTP
jgi:hypothetical protein